MKKNLLPHFFRVARLLPILLCLLSATAVHAASATWLSTPVDNTWNNSNNWMPNTIPNSTTDTATFGASGTTTLNVISPIDIKTITFTAGASPYTLTMANNQTMNIWGSPCITNNSGIEQDFVADGGTFYFHGTQTFDSTIHFELLGGSHARNGGTVIFGGAINTGTASIEMFGSDGFFPPGVVIYNAGNNAGSSTIYLHRGTNGGLGARLIFESGGASSANITAEGSDNKMFNGGYVTFSNAGAGGSTVTLEGSIVPNGRPATAEFSLFASADTSTLLADGGALLFLYASSGGTARAVLTSRGSLDMSGIRSETPGMSIGSVEGDRTGVIWLGKKKLTVGGNNLSATFSGLIQDGGLSGGTGGSLAKTGTRTLTLTGTNLYTGGTTVTQGDLVVTNRTGSATGTGPVQVDGGRIGGGGTIAGALTIGNSSGSAATLIPAIGTNKQMTTTVSSALTFNAGAVYNYGVNSTRASGDKTVASGVTINASATFVFHPSGTVALPSGTVFTAIDNTAATPIFGAFGNLADGATIVAGGNNFVASYTGGDGNDLTLTVL